MTFKKIFFFVFFILVLSVFFVQEVRGGDFCIWDSIIENQNSCIKSVEEDKLYLNEQNIYPTENGLFFLVNDSGDFMHLPNLFSDHKGCYIPFSRLDGLGEYRIEVRNKCPSCGQRYIIKCTNTDCPSKRKR